MAAKLGQGSGKYDDLTNWSGWVMENWQAGLGKREADEEGFLYAECETRFQGQLCLPLYHDLEVTASPVPAKLTNAPVGIDTILEMTTTASIRKLAYRVTPNRNATVGSTWALLFDLQGSNCKVSLYSESGGSPNASLTTGTGTGGAKLAFDYIQHDTGGASFVSGTNYWVVIEPVSGTIKVPVYDHGSAAATRKQWNGSAWANSQYGFFFYVENGDGAYRIVNFQNAPHFVNGTQGQLFKWTGSAISLVTSSLTVSAVTDAIAFGDLLFVGYGMADPLDTWNGTVVATPGESAQCFATWNGYLWRGIENDVYYTADGATWTGPIQIGPDGYNVNGLAGMGDDMYVSTDDGLYKIALGDVVFGVMRYNNISSRNGKGMINHQGALFIPTYSDLLRYGGAEVMSANPMKDEGLPALKQGRAIALLSHNYWLFALVATDATGTWPVLLAYNDQGWHYVGKLMQNDIDFTAISGIAWDTTNDLLWLSGDVALYRYRLPVDHQNPYKDSSGNVRFFPGGMIETPWFYSGLKEIYKDCESVYVTGENITSARPVKVYWQDDDSTDWELLGTVTSNRQELRWSNLSTRPNTRQIKLALVLMTDDYTESPRVDAVRLKFQNMVTDRWRWTLTIQVSDDQEMLDGELNIYTKEQQRTHLEQMARSVPPILLEDVDGTQYEVKVMGATEQVERYEFFDDSPNFTSVYSFTVEQATTESYN